MPDTRKPMTDMTTQKIQIHEYLPGDLIYIAGPLFSEGERTFNLLIEERCIDAGFKTYLPQRDCITLNDTNGDEVCEAEVKANEASSLVVANLDGVDIDSGTAWEIGYAVAQKKVVIGVRTDLRAFSPSEPVNLMFLQSCVIVKSLDELSEYFKFYKAVAAGARR